MNNLFYKRVKEEVIFFNVNSVENKRKIFFQVIDKILIGEIIAKQINNNFVCYENIQNLREKILSDCETWDLEIKNWFFKGVQDISHPKGIIFTGNFGKFIYAHYENTCKEFRTSLYCCLPESEIDDISNPFFYITDSNYYTKPQEIQNYFVHEVTHWYTYKYIIDTIDPKKEKYREALAMLAEKELTGKDHKYEDMGTDAHKEAYELLKDPFYTKEKLIEYIRKNNEI